MEEKPGWGKFFGGCAFLLLLAASVVGAYVYLSRLESGRRAELEAQLFSPYWEAVRAARYDQAASYWREQSPERLAESYRSTIQKHGALVSGVVRIAQGIVRPGESGDRIYVRAILTFAGGWQGPVSYDAVRTPDGWRIDKSSVDSRHNPGPGPY
jgi:hypothetical protein